MITNLGYYINKSYDQLIIGFIDDYKLKGKLIFDKYGSFHYGYKYHSWKRSEYIYIGRPIIFNSLNSYLTFLSNSNTEQIEAYFRCKNIMNNGSEIKRKYLEWECKVLKSF